MNDVERVIDKLAEKVGVAANALKPVAEQVIEQTRMMGIGFACIGLAIVIAIITIHQRLMKIGNDIEQPTDRVAYRTVITIILAIVAVVILATFGYSACVRLLAPTAFLLGLA